MRVQLIPQLIEYPVYDGGTNKPTGEVDLCCHRAIVVVDGERWGEATDCETAWVLISDASLASEDDEDLEGGLDGAFPASSVPSLAYALRECVDGIEGEVEVVSIDPLWPAYLAKLAERNARRREFGDYF